MPTNLKIKVCRLLLKYSINLSFSHPFSSSFPSSPSSSSSSSLSPVVVMYSGRLWTGSHAPLLQIQWENSFVSVYCEDNPNLDPLQYGWVWNTDGILFEWRMNTIMNKYHDISSYCDKLVPYRIGSNIPVSPSST